ncbi:PREDICTED: protein DCL, chloroplastic-like [Tarenaya hassleriana]|uniref:protein DCL, chloroplastic-like n=1 Tax=Tarenaya hassleriana TaxID=28532 RepID=UPI00053CA403|nr:PREDICTED: protein DCL, chloroplastic-like [Tarenaya hassleriana]
MTALSGSSLTVGFVGESTKRRSPSPSIFHFSSRLRFLIPIAVKTRSDGANLLRKPATGNFRPENRSDEAIVDWEDQILEETVPLVNFAKMILHSGRYKNGERLSREHEKAVIEKLLPYHPEYERKIEGGINHIKVMNHPEHGETRCMFVVWRNGEEIDFSYWKCVKGLIRRKYPLHSQNFIFKHFRYHS